jgi:hypothetical protein
MIIRRSRAVALFVLAVLLLSALLGGCARVRAALAVQPDDTVTGELIFATPAKSANDTGPTVALPPDLASAVNVSAYHQDGYTGSLLRFSRLSFGQVVALSHAAFPSADRVQFNLRRAGGRVLVTGSVDLTTVSVDKADFQLKMSFPGRVVDTNGEPDAGTVSWTFTPGEVGDISATVAYADPDGPSPLNWTIGLGSVVALAALLVVVAARRARNPPVSPRIR